VNDYSWTGIDRGSLPDINAPLLITEGDAVAISQYYQLYENYLNTLTNSSNLNIAENTLYFTLYMLPTAWSLGTQVYDGQPQAPEVPKNTAEYNNYLAQYKNYATETYNFWSTMGGAFPEMEPLLPPPTNLVAGPVINTVNNTPAPTATVSNMIPLAMGGGSAG
jgi:hypothetical protein